MSDDERTLQANIKPFGLRLQPDLKSRVEVAARANNRSMNAEIVARLEESFATRTPADITIDDALQITFVADQMHRAVKAMVSANGLTEDLRRTNIFGAMAQLLKTADRARRVIWLYEYDNSPALQEEFLTRESYAAYQAHYAPKDAFGVEWRVNSIKQAFEEMQERLNGSTREQPPPGADK